MRWNYNGWTVRRLPRMGWLSKGLYRTQRRGQRQMAKCNAQCKIEFGFGTLTPGTDHSMNPAGPDTWDESRPFDYEVFT